MSLYNTRPLAERFAEKWMPEPTTGCHLWIAALDDSGYGKIGVRRNGRHRMAMAHRVAWEHEHGTVPDGLSVLHKCDTPACCNVAHLFLGTQADNMQDCVTKDRHFSAYRGKSTCKHGHEFTPENTYTWRGKRKCLVCQRECERRAYAKRRTT